MTRRKQWMVAGGIVASILAGGVAYVLSRGRKSPPPSYVGQPGYVWPHRDLFLDMTGFGEALETFGYDVGDWSSPSWSVLGEDMRGAVIEFQADWNLVSSALGTLPEILLDITGQINAATVEAMAFVNTMQEAGHTWPLIVLEATESMS